MAKHVESAFCRHCGGKKEPKTCPAGHRRAWHWHAGRCLKCEYRKNNPKPRLVLVKARAEEK